MDVVSVKLLPREITGKKVITLRRKGVTPVHMYGGDSPALALQVDAPTLRRILPEVGTNRPLSVQVEGKDGEDICFVRDIQHHPVTDEVIHVDFFRVDVSKTVTAEVPLEFVGQAPAVRTMGGTLIHALNSLEVEALPMRMPESIIVDVSVLDDFEKAIHVSDLNVSADVTITAAPDELVVRVMPPRKEEEPAAAEAAEGAEVEVISKGKDENDEEEDEKK